MYMYLSGLTKFQAVGDSEKQLKGQSQTTKEPLRQNPYQTVEDYKQKIIQDQNSRILSGNEDRLKAEGWTFPATGDTSTMRDINTELDTSTKCTGIETKTSNSPIYYLASPYTYTLEVGEPPAKKGMTQIRRFNKVNEVAANLTKAGFIIFSPISHSHQMAQVADLPVEWEFWERIDKAFINVCGGLFVLKLDGWKESVGVQAEIKIANEIGIPVLYLEA